MQVQINAQHSYQEARQYEKLPLFLAIKINPKKNKNKKVVTQLEWQLSFGTRFSSF